MRQSVVWFGANVYLHVEFNFEYS